MALGSTARILRAPGKLISGPTNLALASPYGGTVLGLTKLCVLQPIGTNLRVLSEGLGEATDLLEMETQYTFSCFLRGWDDDVLRLMFPDHYSAGGVSGHAIYSAPGNAVPGASMLPDALKLLYVPDDAVNVPSLLIYRGLPYWSSGAEVAFQRREELGIPVAVDCLRDASNRILRIGRLADMVL